MNFLFLFLFNLNKLYHHTETCLPVHPKEQDEDSEGESDPVWLRQKTVQMIDEFSDVNEGEKELMKFWNLYVLKDAYVGDCNLPFACETFLRDKGLDIVHKNLYRNFILHMCSLFDYGLVSPEAVYKSVQKLQGILSKDLKGQEMMSKQRDVQLKYWLEVGRHKQEEQKLKSPHKNHPSSNTLENKDVNCTTSKRSANSVLRFSMHTKSGPSLTTSNNLPLSFPSKAVAKKTASQVDDQVLSKETNAENGLKRRLGTGNIKEKPKEELSIRVAEGNQAIKRKNLQKVPNCQQNWEELLAQFKASVNSSSKRGLSKSRIDGVDLSCMEFMAPYLLPNTNVDLGLHDGTSSSGTVTDLLNNSNSSLNVSVPSSMEIHDETSQDQRVRYTCACKRDLDQKLVKDLNESWSVAASPTTRGTPIKGGSKRGESKVPPKDNDLNANFEAVEKPNASSKVKKLAVQPFSKPVINHTDSEAQCTILESKQDHLEFLASFVPQMETYSNWELIVFKCRLYQAALEIDEIRKKKEIEKSTDKGQTTNETQSPGANPVIPESLIRTVIATIMAFEASPEFDMQQVRNKISEFSKIPKITNAAETPITTPATTATPVTVLVNPITPETTTTTVVSAATATVTTKAAATKGATTTALNATVVTAAPTNVAETILSYASAASTASNGVSASTLTNLPYNIPSISVLSPSSLQISPPQSKSLMTKVVASRPLQGQPKNQIIPGMTPPNTVRMPQGMRIIPKSYIQDGSNAYVHPASVSTKVQQIYISVPSASPSGPSNKTINVRNFSPGQSVNITSSTAGPISAATFLNTRNCMPSRRYSTTEQILATTGNDINGSWPQFTNAGSNAEVLRQVRREAIGTLFSPNKAPNSIKQVYRVPTASSSRTPRPASLSTATSTTGSAEVTMSIPGYSNSNLAKSAEQQSDPQSPFRMSYTNVPSYMSASPRPQKRTIVQPKTSKPQPKKKRTQSTYMSTSPSELNTKKEPE